MKSFVTNLFSVFKSKVAMIVFGLGINVITARYLGPEANGIIAALMVYPLIFMNFGSLGIQQSTTYFIGKEKYSLNYIYGGVLAIWIFTSIFCLISCYFLIHFFTVTYSSKLIILAIAGLPFSLYNTYNSGIFLGKQNIKEYNRINWLPTAINFLFVVVFIIFFSLGITGYLLASFLSVFIFSIFLFFKVKKLIKGKPSYNFTIIKELLSLGSIYAISYLVTFLNYRVDILLLEKYSNAYQIGIYSKGAAIVEYLWQLPLLLSTIIFSKSANSSNPKSFSVKACSLLRFAIIVILIALILLYLFSYFIIQILYGSKFLGSISVLRILMPGVLLLTIFRVLNMDIAGRGKPWLSIKAMLPGVIINIILNYFWIPEYGANGSALASTVSYSIAAIIFLIIYSIEVQIPVSSILKFSKEDKTLVNMAYKKFLITLKLKS